MPKKTTAPSQDGFELTERYHITETARSQQVFFAFIQAKINIFRLYGSSSEQTSAQLIKYL